MIRFILKVILFFILAVFILYLFESGMVKKGKDYLFKKTQVQKIIDEKEKKIKEGIKRKIDEKLSDEKIYEKLPKQKEVEKYTEEEKKELEEIIKKSSP